MKLFAISSRNQNILGHSHQAKIIVTLILFLVVILTCKIQAISDPSSLKPSVVLILPQTFKVPTLVAPSDPDQPPKIQQFVAVINNIHNGRDDEIIRGQFKKLSLQVRDARSPNTGQLFYEHVFDYFPPQPGKQYLLIPVNLDKVSSVREYVAPAPVRSYAATQTGLDQLSSVSLTQHLIISIRPYNPESGLSSEGVEFVSSAPIPVEPVPSVDGRRSFGIVQTDKPGYKPQDKVRIRSLVINENLRPVTKDEFKLQIKNPQKVIVEEIRFPNNETQNLDSLYLDHIFEFPPEPILGTWTVHLLHNDPIANDTISFEVSEYVLPTYEIEFESLKYILPNTQVISGHIIAKYHHGKPVQGKAQFKFGYRESANERPKFIARSSIKTIDPTGRVDFKINSEKFKESVWFPTIAGSRLFIEATVTESSTGHREVAIDASCIFTSTPYRISFEDSIEDFKYGLSQQLTVQVLEMQTNRPAPIGTRLIAQYVDQNGVYLDIPSQIANNQTVDFYQILDSEAVTDKSGYASFNVGPVREGITSIQAIIKWVNSTQQLTENNELALGHHVLVKHESTNGWISFMNKTVTRLNVGDIFVSDLLILNAVVIPKKVFYIIVAKGQIIALDSLNSDGLVKFEINESMMPSIRVVLFALTRDQVGLLSDSIRISVGQDLSCGLSLTYKSNDPAQLTSSTFRPNDKGQLAIQARQGDLVSLIGVDSAIYTLNNKSRLDSTRIIQRIKRLDTGCGFGGGKNNLDVFYNAGLMLFKNVHETDPDEPHLGSACLTVQNQLMHIEDIQLGYSRPMFLAAAKQSRPRVLDLTWRNRIASSAYRLRTKRETDIEAIMNRYKDPLERSCCHLGTLEDVPQKRNCSIRSRIVEKYMRHSDHKSCSKIYFDCCRAVFGDYLLLSSMLSARSKVEPVVEVPVSATHYAPTLTEAVVLSNLGHLDQIEMKTLTRRDFRETWLFELVNVDQEDGTAVFDTQLPHSITTWAVTAMSLNKYQPMCLMLHPLKLNIFQEIFLHVSMPYKVVQGEQIDLVATIFNYSPQSQEVQVYMYGVEEICSEAEPGERSDHKRLKLDRHSSYSVIFPIFPLKVGKFPIKVLAITIASSSSDIVERQLNVVPRGKTVIDETTFSLDPLNQQRRSKRAIQTGNLVDEIDSAKALQRSKIRLIPREIENIVPNTQECIINAQLQLMLPQIAGSSLPPSLICNVTVSNHTKRSIEFSKDNAQIQQSFKIDSFDMDSVNGEMIDVVTSGTGIGTMSIKFKYNVFQEEDELCRFNIDSSIDEWQPKVPHNSISDYKSKDQVDGTIEDDYFKSFDRSMLSELNLMPPKQEPQQSQQLQLQLQSTPQRLILLLRVCVQHLSTRHDSEMAVIEIGIISGFKLIEADLKEIIDDPGTPAMKYEISPDRSLVIIFMQYIPYSGVFCLEFRLERESLVYNLQSGYVRVYEYYSPAHSCSNFYTPSRVTDLIDTKCDANRQICSCATRSLCPGTKKLMNLGEIYSVNATSARTQLVNLICSNHYDYVSLVRLKSVQYLEAGKMFKIFVKVKSDLRGNLTAIMDLQQQQKSHLNSSIRKHSYSITDLSSSSDRETSLDYLNVNIDATCVRNDPLLLHLAHPNQWKQGGELMILFARHSKLEKRYAKSSFPRPKSNTIYGVTDGSDQDLLQLIDAQQLQYSLALQLDNESILHDLTYQAKSEGRERINNLLLWLELRSRREKLSCM